MSMKEIILRKRRKLLVLNVIEELIIENEKKRFIDLVIKWSLVIF